MSERRLTKEAQIDNDDFNREFRYSCCSCHISPPCNWCIHPGNPHNQDDCYEPEEIDKRAVRDTMKGLV